MDKSGLINKIDAWLQSRYGQRGTRANAINNKKKYRTNNNSTARKNCGQAYTESDPRASAFEKSSGPVLKE